MNNVDGLFQLGIIVAQARSQEEGSRNIAGSAGHRPGRGRRLAPRRSEPKGQCAPTGHIARLHALARRQPDGLASPSALRALCPHLIGPTLTVP